jgi:hypothetical protein
MKKALISSNEFVINFDGSQGYRVAEVATQTFEVCSTLFWVDCPDDCQADVWYYNTTTNTCVPKPVEPTPEVGE